MKKLLLSTLMITTFGLAAMADAPTTLTDAQMEAVYGGTPTYPRGGGNYTAYQAGGLSDRYNADTHASPHPTTYGEVGQGRSTANHTPGGGWNH